MNSPTITIADCVRQHLDKFFHDLEGDNANAVYDMVLNAVERPLLEFIMERSEQNQSVASKMLGINRNTLRKKLQQHSLLDSI